MGTRENTHRANNAKRRGGLLKAARAGSFRGLGGCLSSILRRRPAVAVSAALAVLIVGWALAIVFLDRYNFAAFSPEVHVEVEAAAGAARLFGALVLVLFPAGQGARRLPWVALGLLVLALGGLGFGYVESLLGDVSELNTSAYEALLVWGAAAVLFAVGLLPEKPPRLTRLRAVALLAAAVAAGVLLDAGGKGFPHCLTRGRLRGHSSPVRTCPTSSPPTGRYRQYRSASRSPLPGGHS